MGKKKCGILQCGFCKRKMIGLGLGLGFGILCVLLASSNSPEMLNVIKYNIIFNRILIGVMVAACGVFSVHPYFGWRLYPALRGGFIGAFISLDIAIGALAIEEDGKIIFIATIISGAIYGLIIDLVATKFGGEGQDLLLCKTEK